MSVCLHTTLEVVAARKSQFLGLMKRIQEIQVQAGWKLIASVEQRTGRFHTFLHLWGLDDYNHYRSGLEYCFAQPDIDEIVSGLADCVASETVVFADRVDYMTQGD